MINKCIIYISITLSGLIVVLLAYNPTIDINCSYTFYDHDLGFIYRNNFFVQFLFHLIPWLTISSSCILLIFYFVARYLQNILLQKSIIYIIFTALIGPGFVVNYILKEYMGRARPVQVKEFGGNRSFTNALHIANQCEHNCSFSSGHAAMGYSYTSIAYAMSLYAQRKSNSNKLKILNKLSFNMYINCTYIFGIILGSIVGVSRILMGGHFLSDVVASCFIILTINHALYLLWRKKIVYAQ